MLRVAGVAILILSLAAATTLSTDCSSNCTCKWFEGKKSAICNSLQLTAIPSTLSPEIQVLHLNDNHIVSLNRNEFTNAGLSNLQQLNIKNSGIEQIHKDTFKKLDLLVKIDLSDNKIELIHEDTFIDNTGLRVLYLNGNPLKKLEAYQFPPLLHLHLLDLHDCQISFIDPMALVNLGSLKFISLKNNHLESLSNNVFQHMNNLWVLELEGNPWHCDCKLKSFRTWYVERRMASVSPTCKEPSKHNGKRWESVHETQFGCLPKVEIFSNEDVQAIDNIGRNTSVSCRINGDPMPEVFWELNGNILDNNNNKNILINQKSVTDDMMWSNLTVFNVNSLNTGIYSCSAENMVGSAKQNINISIKESLQPAVGEIQ